MINNFMYIFISLIIINGLFSAMEFALVATRKDKLKILADSGKSSAIIALKLLEQTRIFLTAAQLGITLCSVLIGYFGHPLANKYLYVLLKNLPLEDIDIRIIESIISTILVIFVHLIFSEIIPKNVALAYPEKTTSLLSYFSKFILIIFRPLLLFFNWITTEILKIFHLKVEDEFKIKLSESELSQMIGDSYTEGLLDNKAHERLLKILAVGKQTIHNSIIMNDKVKTINIPPIALAPSLLQVQEVVQLTGFSRYPILKNGKYVGYVHVKDVLPYLEKKQFENNYVSPNIVHPLPVISSNVSLDQAITFLRRAKTHIAQVIENDEVDSPKIIGIVALEDLVEELIGTVRDETHKIRN